jgi:hypothetical protein
MSKVRSHRIRQAKKKARIKRKAEAARTARK